MCAVCLFDGGLTESILAEIGCSGDHLDRQGVRLRAAETPSCFSEVQLPLPSHPPQLPPRTAPLLPAPAPAFAVLSQETPTRESGVWVHEDLREGPERGRRGQGRGSDPTSLLIFRASHHATALSPPHPQLVGQGWNFIERVPVTTWENLRPPVSWLQCPTSLPVLAQPREAPNSLCLGC